MTKPITNHIHPVTVEELETIHAHVNGTFSPSSIAKEREAYASGKEASTGLFELVAATMPERNSKVLCNIDLSAPIEQIQAEIATLKVWAYGGELPSQPDGLVPALVSALDAALDWIDTVPSDTMLPTMPGFDRDDIDSLLSEAKALGRQPATILHQCDGCGHVYHDPVTQCDCMPDRQTFTQLVAYPVRKGEEAEVEAPNEANYRLKFIPGNPEIFSRVSTGPEQYQTLEDAMQDFDTIDSHSWRGWIEDKDGNRVRETEVEKRWAAKA